MNGFTNAILSLLLGWLRSLFNAIWSLLGSDNSGSFLATLGEHWKAVFLVLCVGGFIVDRIIYLIRWRPYYVWRERRRRKRYARENPQHADDYDDEFDFNRPPRRPAHHNATLPYDPYVGETQKYPQEDTMLYAPPSQYANANQQNYYDPADSFPADGNGQPNYSEPYAYAEPYYGSAPPNTQPLPNQYAENGYPAAFSSDASFAPTASYQALSYQPPLEAEPFIGEPRYDDDLSSWDIHHDSGFSAQQSITADMPPAFGAPQPEPVHHYLHDMQAGYPPQLTPEELYPQNTDPMAEQVHPGLDIETFHQNIGLNNPGALQRTPRRDAAEDYVDFAPFAGVSQEQSDEKPRGLSAIAKKARTLVSGEDEKNPLSLRDLQPTVDVKNAFHAPVYPKKKPESEES